MNKPVVLILLWLDREKVKRGGRTVEEGMLEKAWKVTVT